MSVKLPSMLPMKLMCTGVVGLMFCFMSAMTIPINAVKAVCGYTAITILGCMAVLLLVITWTDCDDPESPPCDQGGDTK